MMTESSVVPESTTVTPAIRPTTARQWIGYSLLLFVACVLLGAWCCQLNLRYYQHHHPFYDSMSYNERVFRVMTITNEQGIQQGLHDACFNSGTNCVPFVICALMAPLASPSRLVGVWIQSGFLYLLLLSTFYYLARVRSVRPLAAFGGCLAFLGLQCLLRENGGLSDFRMDLLLMLTFGMSCVWYLTCMARPTLGHFVLLGLAASLSCLCRATAPVYLLFTLVPLTIYDLVRGDRRTVKISGLMGSAALVAALAGWFFVMNLEYLKFYYLDWNVDSQAHLPLAESIKHLKYALTAFGLPAIVAMIGWSLMTRVATKDSDGDSNVWRDYDPRIAWMGMAPVVMLVAKGAGLNPYVSMPAAFGMFLFLVVPIAIQAGHLSTKRLCLINGYVLVVLISVVGEHSWHRHSSGNFNTQQVQRQIADLLMQQTQKWGESELTFGTLQYNDLNTHSIYSTLMFDYPGVQRHLDRMTIDSVDFKSDMLFAIAAPFTWQHTPGETDEEKITWLVDQAGQRLDYLVVPDAKSAQAIQQHSAHVYINQHLVSLRQKIVDDPSWVKVVGSIQSNAHEAVEIYRRVRPDQVESVADATTGIVR